MLNRTPYSLRRPDAQISNNAIPYGRGHGYSHANVQPQQHSVSNEIMRASTIITAHPINNHDMPQQALNPTASRFNTPTHHTPQNQSDTSNRFVEQVPEAFVAIQRQHALHQRRQQQQRQAALLQRLQSIQARPMDHLYNGVAAMNVASSRPVMHQPEEQMIANDVNHSNFNFSMAQLQQDQDLSHTYGQGYNTTSSHFAPPQYQIVPYGNDSSVPNSTQHSSQYTTPHATPSQQYQLPIQPFPPPPLQPALQHAYGTYLGDYPVRPTPMNTINQAKAYLTALERYKKTTILTEQAGAHNMWCAQKAAIDKLDKEMQGSEGWADHPNIVKQEDRLDGIEEWIKRIGLTWDRCSMDIEEMYAGITTGEFE